MEAKRVKRHKGTRRRTRGKDEVRGKSQNGQTLRLAGLYRVHGVPPLRDIVLRLVEDALHAESDSRDLFVARGEVPPKINANPG